MMKVSKEIASLVPYQPGKPISETQREFRLNTVYKLASNENPLGPSAKVMEAVTKALGEIHRYPDSACYELTNFLSTQYKVDKNWLAFGNGSNEIVDLLIRIFCEPGEKIATSQAAFIAYKICAQAARVETLETALTADLRFDLSALAKVCADPRVRIAFIANPNNPTGTYVSKDELEDFLNKTKDRENLLVVLDEAYCEYVTAKDCPNGLELIKRYPHLAICRTFSKAHGMAGLRLGVLIAHPEVTDLFHRVRNPFNVNSLAQVAAMAAFQDEDYLRRGRELNRQGLEYFYREFDRLGLKYWPSQGNFLLFDCGREGAEVFTALLKKGVIVRQVKGYGLSSRFLRISVGLATENEAAVRALEELIK